MMSSVRVLLADDVVLEHACRGLPVLSSSSVVEAAFELGDLHAARYMNAGSSALNGQRLRLMRDIDMQVADAAPRPRQDARVNAESFGALVDQIASCCAIAFRAPRSLVSAAEIDDALAQLRWLGGEYSHLIDEVAAGSCRLPRPAQSRTERSGIRLLSRRTT